MMKSKSTWAWRVGVSLPAQHIPECVALWLKREDAAPPVFINTYKQKPAVTDE